MAKEKSNGNANQKKTGKENYLGDNAQLVEQIAIPLTPFMAIKANQVWYITLGKYRISEGIPTYAECVKRIQTMDWFLIMGVIQIMIEEHYAISQNANTRREPENGTPQTTGSHEPQGSHQDHTNG